MNTEKVTRVEIVNHYVELNDPHRGREYVFWEKDAKVELSLQDDERTLKIFITK